MSTRAPLRLWRSIAVTSTVMALAAGAHVLGGGPLPGLPVLVLLAALVNLPVVLLAGRRLSLPTLTAVLGLGQWSLHHAFAWFATPPDCTGGAPEVPFGHHGSVVAGICGSASPLAHGAAAHWGSMGLPMITAHLLAIFLSAVALARGEAALWMLMAWLSPLASLPRPAPLAPKGPVQQAMFALPLLRPRSNARAERLRGPPRALLPRSLRP
ncbi:MAG: hypothetical protein ACTHWW_00910 [Arthrobacter sp.]|uniref:hypothetical protein n=1 Tax=Arthrobacter sp. AOP36-A1-22 TaxID=3457684 RepID=UPI003FB7037B